MNNFFVQKIKLLHPKNYTSIKNILQVVILLLAVSLPVLLPTEWKYGAQVFKLPDGKIYTVFYRYGRGSIGPYLYVEHKGVGHMILCYQPKSTREQIKEICHKENRGSQFIGKNVIIYQDQITRKSIIHNAIFTQIDCQESCKSAFIRTSFSDMSNFVNRFKHINVFFLCATLFFGGYLILQIKYRFFNRNEGN